MGLALFGSALEVMLSGPIQNATCPHRALFFHFTTTKMPIYANPMLMKQCCKCKKSKTQGGQDAASKAMSHGECYLPELSACLQSFSERSLIF